MTSHAFAASGLAADQGGVVSLEQLRSYGVTRSQIRAQVEALRWRRVHSQVVAMHTGPLSEQGTWWAAVLEGGPRAHLDGASALLAEGLTGFTTSVVRVSVPPESRARRAEGVDIRRTRRHDAEAVVRRGVPRVRADVAAVNAALWAVSDRQAVLLATMAVQQRLTTPERVGAALLRVRRDRRRALLHACVLDLLGGVRSLGEADFARECRRRGLPEPTRQSVRRGPHGAWYLDVHWEDWGVVVEIDGIQHGWASEVVGDALRQNAITLASDVVLRLPLLGLRVAPEEFFAQIRQALVERGCPLRHVA
ncbi:hypothetical protein [Nocardioides gilvus]|uniref:hypothetical protein n=1 Tax=Nocardioides gilvus TaxID=1735589 RepID=UPI000D7479DD|nr:hypothetical protein [Nocardioides gilvus]